MEVDNLISTSTVDTIPMQDRTSQRGRRENTKTSAILGLCNPEKITELVFEDKKSASKAQALLKSPYVITEWKVVIRGNKIYVSKV
jgi:hypothetical protein